MANKETRWIVNHYPRGTTPNFSGKSLFSTINPFSPFVKGAHDWIPKTMVKLFQGKDTDGSMYKDQNAAKVAHVLLKIALGGAAFGLGAMGLRALMYGTDKKDYKVSKTPTKGLDKLYKKPTAAPLTMLQKDKQQKDSKKINKKADFVYPLTLASLPLLASMLAAGIGAKKADRFFDDLKGKKLKKQQQQLLQEKQRLAIQRIKKARGIQQPSVTMQKSEGLKKRALANTILSGAGLLALTTFLLGRQAGKVLHDSNNEQTVKFKAYKKGLQQYNKARAYQEGVQTEPLDPQMVKFLNSNLDKKTSTSPEIKQDTLKEIMI